MSGGNRTGRPDRWANDGPINKPVIRYPVTRGIRQTDAIRPPTRAPRNIKENATSKGRRDSLMKSKISQLTNVTKENTNRFRHIGFLRSGNEAVLPKISFSTNLAIQTPILNRLSQVCLQNVHLASQVGGTWKTLRFILPDHAEKHVNGRLLVQTKIAHPLFEPCRNAAQDQLQTPPEHQCHQQKTQPQRGKDYFQVLHAEICPSSPVSMQNPSEQLAP